MSENQFHMLMQAIREVADSQEEMQQDISALKQDVSTLKQDVSTLRQDMKKVQATLEDHTESFVYFRKVTADHDERLFKVERKIGLF